jgi:Zn-dependent protease
MLFSFIEIRDIVIMTLAIGFIFRDVFHYKPKVEVLTPEYYMNRAKGFKGFRGINWTDFWFAAAVVAPSIILHEFGHKFVAIAYGMTAVFQAAYTWLAVGIVLKLIGSSFIFFVPAFTSIIGEAAPIQHAAIAFAGPGINLALWLVSLIVLKTAKLKNNHRNFLFLVSRINMFLFIFNLIPIPGFDGYSVFSNLGKVLLG